VRNEIKVVAPQPGSEVKKAIEAALVRSAILNSTKLAVEVDQATVTITGEVHSMDELAEVERTAWSAGGIRRVQNCVTITPWGHGPAEEWGY
jgi:osmotically-inducible protein OsmY